MSSLIVLVLSCLLPSLALAAEAGSPEAPPTAPPQSSDPVCSGTAPASLLQGSQGLPFATIVSPPHRVVSSGIAKFIYLPPSGVTAVPSEFRVFARPRDGGLAAATTALSVIGVVHPVVDATASKALGVSASSAYELTVMTQAGVGWSLVEPEEIAVVACGQASGSSAERPQSMAETTTRLTDRTASAYYAVAVMALVYLLAVHVKWTALQADEAAKVGMKLKGEAGGARISQNRVVPTWWQCWNPVVLSADIFNRASLSQLQILIFLMIVGYSITCSLLRTGTLSELSSSIVYLLGIPAIGSIGSQAANSARGRFSADNWAWLVGQQVLTIDDSGTGMPQWRYILTSGNNIDLYKLQAFTFTIIVGTAMVYSGASLESFTVPDTLLQILGLSQVVFVGGGLTRPATVADADTAVTDLRKRLDELRAAATSGIDVDASGQPSRPASATAAVHVIASLDQARRIAPNAVARYSEAATGLKVQLRRLTYREVNTSELDNPFTPSPPLATAAAAPDEPLL